MAKKQNDFSNADIRKREFLIRFSRESPFVRESIVKDLSAYNQLLSLEAESFREIALYALAEERNEFYDPSHPPVPNCPSCGTNVHAGKRGSSFICTACNKKYTAHHNSIISDTKCDALTWMKVLQCILNFTSITATCEFCDIEETTYYNIRNKLFYAMQLLLEDVKLYGNVQVDNTFVPISYKGLDLRESEFEEDSIFFDPTLKPRSGRKRGGSYTHKERNANEICVFTAIDDRGHVMLRFAGVGAACYNVLKNAVPAEKILPVVPEEDPFRTLQKIRSKEPQTEPGDHTLVVSDKEHALVRFFESLNLDIEAHVFRSRNKQRRLPEGAHNIQRVNALHRRFKEFLSRTHHVSSKYLPGFLTLFEFIENTGASEEAVRQLFRILVKPGLGKSKTFFKELYTVPNYLQEWLSGPNPLRKLPYNKLLAFYLLDHIKHREQYPGVRMTMAHIEEEVNYTADTIRKWYRELDDAGYRDIIINHFEGKKMATTYRAPRKLSAAPETINAVVLDIFDDYAAMRKLSADKQIPLSDFLNEKNEQHNTKYSRSNILAKFDYIVQRGIRPPLPPRPRKVRANGKANGHVLTDNALNILADYDRLVLQYREKGLPVPKRIQLASILGEKYNISPTTILTRVSDARAYLRTMDSSNENKET